MRFPGSTRMTSIARRWIRARATWVILAMVVAATVIAGSATTWATASLGTFSTFALGDSYSAGEGVPDASGHFIPPTNTPKDRCHRSYYAYSQDVAGTRGFPSASNIVFAACSGAIIADFYHPNAHNHEPSQQSYLVNANGSPNTSVRLVMLTIGGNDVEFPYVMATCLALPECQKVENPIITALINHTEPRLRQLYQRILHDAPNAQIFVLGYPKIIATHPSLVCQADGIQPGEATWFDRKAVELDAAVRLAVSEAGTPSRLHYISTLNAFAGGKACSRSGSTGGTYMNGIVARHYMYSFHPNKAGQEILASLLAHAVRGG
jgi:lysophospholipase L1-like esterase